MTAVLPNPTLTIAEAADVAGVTAHTLRYYERDGLMLRSVPRSASGHRRYSDREVEWIRLITKLRATGMPIREIRAYAELVRAGEGTESERLELLCAHRQRVLAQLAEVTGHLGAIEKKIDFYRGRAECTGA